ncbi:MAG TPA: TraM recognition domain-containing protein [Acidimicrobiales bacterium]|nr:TraM recognition domain-containing protein [Acidimicrobiales bacterium]
MAAWTASGLSGEGWMWPGPGRFLAGAAGALASPARPLSRWSSLSSSELRGPAPGHGAVGVFWLVAGLLVVAEAVVALCFLGPLTRGGVCALPRLGAASLRHPLPDPRDRHGFASAAQLRREASVQAARRRANQTRPSLAGIPRRKLSSSQVGYPLGTARRARRQLWANWESSLRLVAPPGEGKTFRVLAPILRQHPGPALATSTKPDIYELTAVARRRQGPVVAIDPDAMVPAAQPVCWSPVEGCCSSEVAERRAGAFVSAVGEDKESQNSGFFRDSARDLLKAYLHAAALEGLDMRSVLAWSRRPDDPTPAEILATATGAAPGWADLVELHTTGAEETTSGVMRYVARSLACFSHESVVSSCCPSPGTATQIEDLLLACGTIYLMGKGSRLGAVAPLITAFADEVFDTAERLAARMPTRRLDPPLLGLLDEAPNIAPLPSLPELLADGRGRGIVVVYAMQSFSQAVSRWGEKKAETMGNATTITAVMGGLTSSNDLADLERLCGQKKVKQASVSRSRSGRNGGEFSRSTSWANEPVLRADQVRTLPSGTALLFWGKLPPVLAELPLLSETRDWPAVRSEESAARLANDRARGLGPPFSREGTGSDPAVQLPILSRDPTLAAFEPSPVFEPSSVFETGQERSPL